jgi:hypothetical protein
VFLQSTRDRLDASHLASASEAFGGSAAQEIDPANKKGIKANETANFANILRYSIKGPAADELRRGPN